MAGTSNLIRTQNILRGTLNADNLMASDIGTAYNPTYAVVTETGAQIALYINSSDYKMHAELKDKFGNHLADSNIIDLPLETMVVNARYDAATKEVVLILDNGNELRFSVADLVEGLVSTEQLQEVLGDYVKFTDYAGSEKAGIIKTNATNYGTNVSSSNGTLYGSTKTYAQYIDSSFNTNGFISKGTLENVIVGKELTDKTYVDEADAKFEDELFGDEEVYNEGEEITLDNTIENSYLKLDLKGNTEQESTSGNQLFNIDGDVSAGTLIKYNNGFTLVRETNRTVRFALPQEMSAGTYTLNFDLIDSTLSENIKFGCVPQTSDYTSIITFYPLNDKTVTINQSFKYLYFFINNDQSDGTTITLDNIMFTLGSVPENYEPYTGGEPSPNPEFPQEIKNVSGENEIIITGKNLFDKDNANILKANLNNQTNINNNISNGNRLFYLPIKPNTTYTIQKLVSLYFVIGTTEVLPDYGVAYSQRIADSTASNLTITTNLNAKYLICWFWNSSDTLTEQQILDSIQVEENSQATTYEPYISRTFPINLNSKNLFDITAFENQLVTGKILNDSGAEVSDATSTYSKYVIPVKANTTYYRKGAWQRIYVYDKNMTLLTRGSAANGFNSSFTVEQDGYIGFQVSNTYWASNKGQEQIEENDHATSYMPYTTPYDIQLCKQDTYQDFIKRSTGKNLFDKNNANILNDVYIAANILETAGAKCLYISALPNTTYTVSKIKSARFTVASTTNKPALNVTVHNRIENRDATSITITTSSVDNYLVFFYYYSTYDTLTEQQILDSIQIEEGNTATSYEPYGHHFYLHKNIENIVLDGSEEWSKAAATDGFRYVYKALANNIIYPSSGAIIGMVLSNMFKPISANQTSASVNGIAIGNTGNLVIYYDEQKDSGIEGFKTWLSTYNTKVQYVLATPTYEVITNPILIKQLEDIYNACTYKSQTNINQINEKMPFEIAATALRATTSGKIVDVNNKINDINNIIGNVEALLTNLDIGNGVE